MPTSFCVFKGKKTKRHLPDAIAVPVLSAENYLPMNTLSLLQTCGSHNNHIVNTFYNWQS